MKENFGGRINGKDVYILTDNVHKKIKGIKIKFEDYKNCFPKIMKKCYDNGKDLIEKCKK